MLDHPTRESDFKRIPGTIRLPRFISANYHLSPALKVMLKKTKARFRPKMNIYTRYYFFILLSIIFALVLKNLIATSGNSEIFVFIV